MSSLATFTLKESIILLVMTSDVAQVRTTKVEHKWGASKDYVKMNLPVCAEPSNKELFLYVINQFLDATHEDHLHLTTGPQRYNKFHAVIDGTIRISWQSISDT